jgi:hypothetical protein
MTRAVEPNVDDTIVQHIDKFNIPAVGLHGRADQVDDALDFITQGRVLGC